MTKLRFRPVAVMMLVLHLAGCTAWTPAPADLRETLSQSAPKQVRVTTADGTRTVVKGPRVVNDSLLSSEQVCPPPMAVGGRTMCREEIRQVAAVHELVLVEVQEVSAGRSAGVVLTLVAVLVAGFTVMAINMYGGDK